MLIKNDFTVPRSVDDVWAYLLDVEKVAPCMPGAELTETVDDRNWKGKLNMKFGPVAMSFAGTVALEERDDAAHRVKLARQGHGAEGQGRGERHGHVVDGAGRRRHARLHGGRHHADRRRRAAVPRLAARGLQALDGAVRRVPPGDARGRTRVPPTGRTHRPPVAAKPVGGIGLGPGRDVVEHRELLQAPVRGSKREASS